MKLSVALIVRNESSEIQKCLNTALGVDEIVVVDTGSEDDTIDKVWEWDSKNQTDDGGIVRVGSFEWCDDFSAARNYAASLCTGDWILTLSADSRLGLGALEALRKALEAATPEHDAVIVTQKSANGVSTHSRALVHRPGVPWVGEVHENLKYSNPLAAPEVVVLYGWSDSHYKDPQRNLRILTKAWVARPSPRIAYYLGKEYFERARFNEALEWFNKHADMSLKAWRPEVADGHLHAARILWAMSEGDAARARCSLSLIYAPDCREALLFMAEMSYPAEAAIWRKFASTATNRGVLFIRNP